MEDLVEAVVEQVAVVSDHKEGALVGIDQVPKGVQVLEIQEHVGFVHDDEFRADHHFADGLHQLEFTAGKTGEKLVLIACKPGNLQLLADVAFVEIAVDGVKFIQGGLILFH